MTLKALLPTSDIPASIRTESDAYSLTHPERTTLKRLSLTDLIGHLTATDPKYKDQTVTLLVGNHRAVFDLDQETRHDKTGFRLSLYKKHPTKNHFDWTETYYFFLSVEEILNTFQKHYEAILAGIEQEIMVPKGLDAAYWRF